MTIWLRNEALVFLSPLSAGGQVLRKNNVRHADPMILQGLDKLQRHARSSARLLLPAGRASEFAAAAAAPHGQTIRGADDRIRDRSVTSSADMRA
jgi:hypothetical protein